MWGADLAGLGLLAGGVLIYTYNATNRLMSVTDGLTLTMSFTYNG